MEEGRGEEISHFGPKLARRRPILGQYVEKKCDDEDEKIWAKLAK